MIKFVIIFLTVCLLKVTVSVPTPFRSSGKLWNKQHHEPNHHSKLAGIYGSHNITIKKANYIAALVETDRHFIGSAVILTNLWIATAAYNTFGRQPGNIIVRTGSSNATGGGTLYNVFKIIPHPKYQGMWDYDIALLKLENPLQFSAVTQKIKLANRLPNNGANTIISGYGLNNNTHYLQQGYLQQASVPYLDNKHCKPHYDEPDFTKYSLCTSKENVGPCDMDYGSPLIYNKKLIGIFSGAYVCGSTDFPPVYADTTKFNSWIKETIKKNSEPGEDLLEVDDE